jgi:hypothetical protein
MKDAAKKIQLSAQTELEFTVEPAPFRPSGNLKFLDLGKLRSRRARFEVGEYDSGCCATKLYAVVEGGMVVRLELEKRKGWKAPPAHVKPILVKAVEALARNSPPDFKPVPVEEFVQALQRDSSPGGSVSNTTCFWIVINLPWVGLQGFGCCVTWHRDSSGKLVIDDLKCGDILSFQH